MENEKGNYISQGGPIMIVKKMTKKVVKEAIKVYAEDDAYYLKFYMLLHQILKRQSYYKDHFIARSKFLDYFLEKTKFIYNIENYDLIDFNINNS